MTPRETDSGVQHVDQAYFKLPRELSARIDRYPIGLTRPQLVFLLEARASQADTEKELPQFQTTDERDTQMRQVRLARRRTVISLRSNEMFPQEDPLYDALFDDSKNIDELIGNANLRLAIKAAQKFKSYDVPFIDRFGAAVSGLANAIRLFNPNLGYQFSTYAVRAIDNTVRKFMQENRKIVRLPLAEIIRARNIAEALEQESDRYPSVDQIVAKMTEEYDDISEEAARLYATLAIADVMNVRSLDFPVQELRHGDKVPLGDTIASEPQPQVPPFSDETVQALIDYSPLELDVIKARFEDGYSRARVGELLGISESIVMGIENKILRQLTTNPTMLALKQRGEAQVVSAGDHDFVRVEYSGDDIPRNPELQATVLHHALLDQLEYIPLPERSAAIAEGVRQVRSLIPEEATVFATSLVRRIGRSNSQLMDDVELQLLAGMRLEEVQGISVANEYIGRLRHIDAETDPELLLSVGNVLSGNFSFNDSIRERIHSAWGEIIRREYKHSEKWQRIAPRVQTMIETMKHKLYPDVGVLNEFFGERAGEFYGGSLTPDGTYPIGSPQQVVREDARVALEALDEEQLNSLVLKLIETISHDETGWEVNRRDVAGEILALVDPNKVDKNHARAAYVDAIRSQPSEADPLGAIYSLAEAGDTLKDLMPRSLATERSVQEAWMTVATTQGDTTIWRQITKRFIEPDRKTLPELTLLEQDVIRDYATKSAQEIAIEQGFGSVSEVYTIVNLARLHGFDIPQKARGPQVDPEIDARDRRIVADLEAGLTAAEIAQREGFGSRKTVYSIARKFEERYGVKINKPKRAKNVAQTQSRLEVDEPLDEAAASEKTSLEHVTEANYDMQEGPEENTVGDLAFDVNDEETEIDAQQSQQEITRRSRLGYDDVE